MIPCELLHLYLHRCPRPLAREAEAREIADIRYLVAGLLFGALGQVAGKAYLGGSKKFLL